MNRVLIEGVHIEHVRHLRDIDIPIPQGADRPRHLILTGRNGSGKTSILDAIAGYIEAVCKYPCPSELERSVGDCEANLVLLQRSPNENEDSLRRAKADCSNFESLLRDAKHGLALTFSMRDTEVRERYWYGDCLFAYFRAHRQFSADVPTSIEKVVFSDVYGINGSPRNLFIKYLLDLKMTQALALANGRDERAETISVWFDRVRDVLRKIYEDPALELDFDEETYRFTIREDGRDPFDFNEASDGFSAVLDIVVGLMLRMVRKNGRSPEFTMSGIALVDEVENHLHLSLQKQILPLFVELFPNVQFIVSTHSPFVLTSLPNAVVFDLETKTLVADGLSGNTYESIVEGYFNVDSLSAELREKYDRYRQLASKARLDDAELLEARGLELYLDEIPDYLALDISTEYQKAKLELHAKVVDE